MAANVYQPHILILPEDDANKDIAVGFELKLNKNVRQFQILKPSGGWLEVIDDFKKNEITGLRTYKQRLLVLVIDCDDNLTRFSQIRQNDIPTDLQDRVFILGVSSEPEKLKSNRKGGFEQIGIDLADDCANNSINTWNDELLKHNLSELERLSQKARPFLF